MKPVCIDCGGMVPDIPDWIAGSTRYRCGQCSGHAYQVPPASRPSGILGGQTPEPAPAPIGMPALFRWRSHDPIPAALAGPDGRMSHGQAQDVMAGALAAA